MIRPRAERRRHSCQPSTEPNQTVGELQQLANVVIVVVVDLNSVLGQARQGKARQGQRLFGKEQRSKRAVVIFLRLERGE